jgi:hypothetical protein
MRSSAASDVYKRQPQNPENMEMYSLLFNGIKIIITWSLFVYMLALKT